MTFKQFGIFALVWVLVCMAVIEPTLVTPYFNGISGLELAFGGLPEMYANEMHANHSTYAAIAALQADHYPSGDHFRVLCLLYFALPCVVYLVSHAWQERKTSPRCG
ncbi:MAG: hypothetical protein R3194_08610 [Limnobacter sp.]|nr:hypothetical protein [Limnobacter sp.]